MTDAPAPAPVPAPAAAALPGVGEILTAGTTVTLDNAGLLLGLWAACGLPPQLLGIVVGITTGLRDKETLKAALESRDFHTLLPLAAVGVLGMAFGILGYAATIRLAARALRGQERGVGDLLVEGAGRVFALVVASIVVGLAIGSGLLLFIVPGLYLVVRLSLAVCTACADDAGPFASIGRSWTLTGGRFWETMTFVSALGVIGLAAAVAVLAAGFVLRRVGASAGEAGSALAGLVANAFQFVVSGWGAACMTKFYLELSARGPAAS